MKVFIALALVAVATAGVVKRATDPCADPALLEVNTFFEDPDNCAGYIQCVNGASVKQCCNAGLQWDATLNTCNHQTTCSKTCKVATAAPKPSTTTMSLKADECHSGNYIYATGLTTGSFRQISLDRMIEYNMDCPAAAPTFSLADCACVAPKDVVIAPASTCKVYTYDNSYTVDGMWVEVSNVELNNGQACFDQGSISIPFFNNMDFRQAMTIQVDVDASATQGKATLVSNGNDKTDATVEISMENGQVTAKLAADTDCTVSVEVAAKDNVKMTYDGAELKLVTDKKDAVVACTGNVKQAESFIVGHNFNGCMDNLMVCKSVE